MKLFFALVTIVSFFFLLSCNRGVDYGINDLGLSGKWNIVSDSSGQGVAAANHLVIYNGQVGDYFDFRVDGKLYIKENTALDTLNYTQIAEDSVKITSFVYDAPGDIETCSITHISSNTIVINTNIYCCSPGGNFNRVATLTR